MKTLNESDKQYILRAIRNVPDYPKPGIQFKDITTMINDPQVFHFLMDHLHARYEDQNIDFIAGIESRGFIFGAALAARLRTRFVPIRKPGKLPYTTISEKYTLEYGFDEVELHIDAFECDKENPKVLLIDDLIATGGTAKAAVNLINKAGAKCAEACFIVNLAFLQGDADIKEQTEVYSVLEID